MIETFVPRLRNGGTARKPEFRPLYLLTSERERAAVIDWLKLHRPDLLPRPVAPLRPPSVRRKRRKPRGRPSYASLPTTMLATSRVRNMTGLGIRVLLACHALWRGSPPLLLPTTLIPVILGIERGRFARGRAEVIGSGLLEETKAYIRPGGAGDRAEGIGRAAEYDLPHAHKGAQVPLDPGDKRLPGYWRIMSSDLVRLIGMARDEDGKPAQFFTDNQLRVVIVLAQGPRTKAGALIDPATHQTTAMAIAQQLPRLTVRTVQRALVAIEARGLARKIGGGLGRAAAIYQPDGLLAAGLPWARARKHKS